MSEIKANDKVQMLRTGTVIRRTRDDHGVTHSVQIQWDDNPDGPRTWHSVACVTRED